MLTKGIQGKKTIVVAAGDTARSIGSGALEVFATAAMIALMEGTAMESVQPYLPEGQGTVGIAIDATHTAPSPVGITVRCATTLTAIDGRKLTFAIEASDEAGPIGAATHTRFIIDNARFMEKTQAKLRRE